MLIVLQMQPLNNLHIIMTAPSLSNSSFKYGIILYTLSPTAATKMAYLHPIQPFQLEDPLFIYNQQYIGWCGPLLQTIKSLDTSKVNERSNGKKPSLCTVIRKDMDLIIFSTLRLEDWMIRLLLGTS